MDAIPFCTQQPCNCEPAERGTETERRQGVEDGLDGRKPALDSVAYLKGYAAGARHANILRELYNEGCMS